MRPTWGCPWRWHRKMYNLSRILQLKCWVAQLDSVTWHQFLQAFHWFPVALHAQFKLLVITYEALYDLRSRYLKYCLIQQISVQPLRSSGKVILWILSLVGGPGKGAFSIIAPNIAIPCPGRFTWLLCWIFIFRRAKKALWRWAFRISSWGFFFCGFKYFLFYFYSLSTFNGFLSCIKQCFNSGKVEYKFDR